MKRLLLAMLLFLGSVTCATAATCSGVPYTFVNGTIADGTQVNANFTAVLGCITGNAASNGANSDITSLSALTTITASGLGAFGSITSSGDITATGTGQVQLPAGTTGQRTGSPVNGDVRYNTTTGLYEAYNSAAGGWGPFSLLPQISPQLRLTIQTATPVIASTISSATTMYYTPYTGNLVPIWNGSVFQTTTVTELSQALSDTVNSPAAAAVSSCYDMFVWLKSGTPVVSRGPAWTNCTSRGYSLNRVYGILVNASNIGNGPAAGFGTYVGSIFTDASANVDYIFGSSAAGGGQGIFGVWNEYNRREVETTVTDSNASWTYGTATWRAADNSGNNSVVFMQGLIEDGVRGAYTDYAGTSSSNAENGVAINNSTPCGSVGVFNATVATSATAVCSQQPVVGQNTITAQEFSSAAGSTFHGNGQGGLVVSFTN